MSGARPSRGLGRLARWGTLRTRIVIATALISTVGMVALVVLVLLLTDRSTDREITSDLNTRVSAVQATAVESGGDLTVANADDALFDTLSWIYDTHDKLVVGPTVPAILRPVVTRMSRERHVTEADRLQFRLKSAPITAHGEKIGTAVVALNVAPYRGVLKRAAAASSGLGLAVIVGMTVLSAVIVRRALAPVVTMAATADSWSQDRLDQRFSLGTQHDEITGLGAVLDRLLDRVGGSIRAEQRLTAELAHELRSPLTVVQGEAELGAAAHRGAARDRFQRIAAAAEEMSTAMTVLLDLARGSVGADARADVGAAIAAVVARHPDDGVQVVVEAPDAAAVAVPRELVERIVAPILENASRYAVRRIQISVRDELAGVRISISNDGPPVSAEGADIFAPGARSADSPGSGLGLSLARRLAKTAGGDVHLASSNPVTFDVTLPVTRSPSEHTRPDPESRAS